MTGDASVERSGASAALWEIRVGIMATSEEAEALLAQVQRLLCEDPEHEGPCRIPWSTTLIGDSGGLSEEYGELVEQARFES